MGYRMYSAYRKALSVPVAPGKIIGR